jgi:hypothetical protein
MCFEEHRCMTVGPECSFLGVELLAPDLDVVDSVKSRIWMLTTNVNARGEEGTSGCTHHRHPTVTLDTLFAARYLGLVSAAKFFPGSDCFHSI